MRQFLVAIIYLFLFSACSKQIYLAEIKNKSARIDRTSHAVDPSVSELIAPYKVQLDSTMNEKIGDVEAELIKSKPNSNLGNWFADVLYEEAVNINPEVDFAIQNYGGLRIPSISAGPITVGKIYELMPFDNILYIQELNGDVVQQLLDKIADYGGWPVSHTLSFVADYGIAKDIMIKGQSLIANKIYLVALPDYIANGGDNCIFLVNQPTTDTGMQIRDLVIKNLKSKRDSGLKVPNNRETRIKD